MDFWGTKIDISREVAARHVNIYRKFPSEKRARIALEFAEMGIQRTHDWIRRRNPEYSELEIRLEFVRKIYFEAGTMSEDKWLFFQKTMEEMIRKDWAKRFRKMMEVKGWTYDDVARFGRFSSGKVVEATISRGLPSFAKLAVVLFEQGKFQLS